MENTRREALRKYLLAVAGDLAARGLVRKGAGHSLEEILRSEPGAVLRQVQDDLAAVGLGFLGEGLQYLEASPHPLARAAAYVIRDVKDRLAAPKGRR